MHRQDDAVVFGPTGGPDVILAGHSDTVPEQGNLPGRLENGQVHGLGAADMKGSLAVMLTLAAELDRLQLQLNPLFVIFGREELPLAESVLERLFTSCPSILEARLAGIIGPHDVRVDGGRSGQHTGSSR